MKQGKQYYKLCEKETPKNRALFDSLICDYSWFEKVSTCTWVYNESCDLIFHVLVARALCLFSASGFYLSGKTSNSPSFSLGHAIVFIIHCHVIFVAIQKKN